MDHDFVEAIINIPDERIKLMNKDGKGVYIAAKFNNVSKGESGKLAININIHADLIKFITEE